ncbi:hypothetical protein ABMA28_015158 [Loxostege sticticalis]|uniref:Mutant cadherin n=1 Tax=Loxostege sticticalis TaxID=481309 RepID=A0ABD0TEM3_LOXSC
MSSEKLIANELLAFLQHAIDTMDEVSILQICKSNFKEEEICKSKVLLYETLGQADRMPTRRRDVKGERSLQDMINLLKSTDPDDVPAFVAKELHKLPPVTFDHVDVTRLLKDITTLKADLAEVKFKLEISESTISGLSTELLSLKNNNCVNRSPEFSNVNTRRGAQNASISSLLSSPVTAELRESRVTARPAARSPAPQLSSSASAATTPPRAYAAAAAAPAPAAAPASAAVSAPLNKRISDGGKTKNRSKPADKLVPPSGSRKSQADEEGFVKVVRKTRKSARRNICGTAPTESTHTLRAAIPSTPLYVSRVHWSTKVEDVVDYVQKKSNFRLRVERLESRHKTNFNSFLVRVPTHHLPTFMKEDFWPQGVVFRKFRGRLPADTAHTSTFMRVK